MFSQTSLSDNKFSICICCVPPTLWELKLHWGMFIYNVAQHKPVPKTYAFPINILDIYIFASQAPDLSGHWREQLRNMYTPCRGLEYTILNWKIATVRRTVILCCIKQCLCSAQRLCTVHCKTCGYKDKCFLYWQCLSIVNNTVCVYWQSSVCVLIAVFGYCTCRTAFVSCT